MAPQVGKVVCVVSSYWAISISMVFANKYLVGEKNAADITLVVSWLQCVVTVILTLTFNVTLSMARTGSASVETIMPKWAAFKARSVLLMSLCFVCMLSFNNMCLRLVGVSFYQIARSTTIIFVVTFSVLILKRSVSKWVVICCAFIASGFFLGIDQEKVIGSLSVLGVVFGVTSSVFIALTGIFTKSALDVVDRNELRLTLASNLIASVAFIPVIIISGQLSAALTSGQVADYYFWVLIVCTGGVGTLLSWISAVQINVTSPITHHISTNSKAILQTVIAVLYYGEVKSALWWFSVILVVSGACAYAIVRYREEKASSAAAQSLPVTVTDTSAVPEEVHNDSLGDLIISEKK